MTRHRMRLDTITDETGLVRIEIPGRPSCHRVRVTVEWDQPAEDLSEWPPGWIETTAGSITDPTFVRHPQGHREDREPLA